MEKLVELSGLVTGVITPDNARSLFKESNGDPKAYLLFDGILKNRYATDKQAARAIYDCKPSDKKYQMLKSRVKTRLLQLVFSMDLSKRARSRYTRALFDCNRKIYAAKQLIALGYRHLVSDSIQDIYKIALKYQFSDIQLMAARLLRDDEVFSGNEGKTEYYNAIIEDLNKAIEHELISEKCENSMRALLRKSVSLNSSDLEKAQTYFNTCKKLLNGNNIPTDALVKNVNRVSIYYYHIRNDHDMVLSVCEEF